MRKLPKSMYKQVLRKCFDSPINHKPVSIKKILRMTERNLKIQTMETGKKTKKVEKHLSLQIQSATWNSHFT